MNQSFPQYWVVSIFWSSNVNRICNCFVFKNFFRFHFDKGMCLISIVIPNLKSLIKVICKSNFLFRFFLCNVRTFAWIDYESNKKVFKILTVFFRKNVEDMTFKSTKSLLLCGL